MKTECVENTVLVCGFNIKSLSNLITLSINQKGHFTGAVYHIKPDGM